MFKAKYIGLAHHLSLLSNTHNAIPNTSLQHFNSENAHATDLEDIRHSDDGLHFRESNFHWSEIFKNSKKDVYRPERF